MKSESKVITIDRAPGDFVRDTQHLSTLEVGAFQLICDYIVIRGQDCDPPSLPDDDAILATVTRLSRGQWRKVKPRLCLGDMAVLTVAHGRISQIRVAVEIEEARARIAAASAAGKASGKARRLNAEMRERLMNGERTAVQRPLENRSIVQGRESNGSRTIHHSPVTSNQEQNQERETSTTAHARTEGIEISPRRFDFLTEQVRKFRAQPGALEMESSDPETYAAEFCGTIGYPPDVWDAISREHFGRPE